MSDLKSFLKNTTFEHQQVFVLFVMYGVPVSQTRFLKIINSAKIRNPVSGKNFTSAQLGKFFARLKKEAIIEGHKGGDWQVLSSAGNLLAHQSVQEHYEKWFPGIEKALEEAKQVYAKTSHYFRSQQYSFDRVRSITLQSFRLALSHPHLTQDQKKQAFAKAFADMDHFGLNVRGFGQIYLIWERAITRFGIYWVRVPGFMPLKLWDCLF